MGVKFVLLLVLELGVRFIFRVSATSGDEDIPALLNYTSGIELKT